jgi:hypothetical protein
MIQDEKDENKTIPTVINLTLDDTIKIKVNGSLITLSEFNG